MSIEDIFRAAKKANGENFEKPPEYPPSSPPPQYGSPTKWYEKKWGIALALIICFPLGAILLWQNPRYSNQAKGRVTAGIIFLFLFHCFSTYEPNPGVEWKQNNQKQQTSDSNTYDIGYLKKGTSWQDENQKWVYNLKDIKVEIWNRHVVTGEGLKLTQIYFLEGEYMGSWGYTRENFLSK